MRIGGGGHLPPRKQPTGKAKTERERVMEIFEPPDVPFSLDPRERRAEQLAYSTMKLVEYVNYRNCKPGSAPSKPAPKPARKGRGKGKLPLNPRYTRQGVARSGRTTDRPAGPVKPDNDHESDGQRQDSSPDGPGPTHAPRGAKAGKAAPGLRPSAGGGPGGEGKRPAPPAHPKRKCPGAGCSVELPAGFAGAVCMACVRKNMRK